MKVVTKIVMAVDKDCDSWGRRLYWLQMKMETAQTAADEDADEG